MKLCLLSGISLVVSAYCLLANSSDMYEYIFILPRLYSVVRALFFISIGSVGVGT